MGLSGRRRPGGPGAGKLGRVTFDDGLPEGLYESVVSSRLLERLAQRQDLFQQIAAVDEADQPHVLAGHVTDAVLRGLHSRRRPDERVALIARILDLLEEPEQSPIGGVRQLLSLTTPSGPGATRIDASRRPSTPLSDAALLTNAPGEPGVGSELRAELATCDEVDLLCAFVMWPGIRVLESGLKQARLRGVPIRIVTTTYLGGTERQALDRLARDYGAEIRVQYDARRSRLHAKAWLFRRRSGFDTAYVGSSNLSRAALLDGIEWNVRLSRVATPSLLDKFLATFDTYWNSDSFGTYDPEQDRDRLDDALAVARGDRRQSGAISLSGLEVRPYPYQQAILDALAAERENHDRHHNLVVAATGTGKTVIAALDYRSLARATGTNPRVLFVAHRGEILQQSLRTYREALVDPNFGELYVGGARPERWDHVFASVQALSAYDVRNIPAGHFEVVVIDEFHHAEAPTYRRILEHLQPKELLGLTATPERGDGTDVRLLFDGRTAAELRLWDAINQGLLSPFHYFGVGDNTDLTHVTWHNGRYDDAELSNVYTGNRARAAVVLKEVRDKIADPTRMRALGFCASVGHAEFMSHIFNDAGIPAGFVSGQTSPAARADSLARLRDGRLSALFAADLLNEGVDIPLVDTVLFLRPTESPTLFLQQLGRGLRLAPDKDVLTVLDFVGRNRAEFRLDLRYRALTGATRKGLQHQVEKGFPFLPSGCEIVLDEVTQAGVLANIRQHLALRWDQLVKELRAHPTDRLPEFLGDSGAELAQVVRQGRSWTQLRRDAGLLTGTPSAAEGALLKRVRALTHVDDRARASAYRRLLSESPGPELVSDDPYARMLFYTLWPNGGGYADYRAGWRALAENGQAREELRIVVDLAFDTTRHLARPDDSAIDGLPLAVHGSYQREEILAALGHATLQRPPSQFREGVLRTEVNGRPVDAFFVTLNKSEADYSPSTMYRDYPISPTLFHWESQSTTSVASPTGQRYLNGGSTVLLFVRPEKSNDFGTAPYVNLGPATYVSHTGDRPIAITWKLRHPMPGDLFASTAMAVG
jgi:superfamily II DNA or RNA helicase/HKD family nuclease